MGVRFDYNRRGGLTLNRDSLHESDGYKRQVEALKQLSDGEAVMGEKMTLTEVRDYHLTIAARHEAAGSDFEAYEKHKAMADALDAHLTQPAQAVDVEKVREERDSQQRAAIAAIDRAERAEALLRECLDILPIHPATHARITAHLSENSRG